MRECRIPLLPSLIPACILADPRITEHRNPRTAEIDLANPLQIVDLLNAEDRGVAAAVGEQRVAIANVIVAVEHAIRAGGRLFYIGAGTSGRLGVLDASEIPPTFGAEPDLVQGIIAGGPAALTRSQEGAEDNVDDGAAQIDKREVTAHDVVIGIAASGTTPWVRSALVRAKELGAITALVACSPPPRDTLAVVDHPIVVVVGPEAVTGSTRMKAGTATKLVLNTITTGAMIRLGKTYGNLMVDLRATNDKLRDRSERIVEEVAAVDRDGARKLLGDAGGHVKLALVMHALGVDATEAKRLLDVAGGVIRRVVPGPPPPVK
jgi:N-acetylmuramic acid 6-phosphate etherase